MKKTITLLFVFLSLGLYAQVIPVHTSNELQNALNNARPGHVITLDDNKTYSVATCTNCITNNGSGFKVPIGVNGTPNNPIKLVGSKSSVITSENVNSKYGLHLQGNRYWILEGFTVTNSSKCVMLDSSSYNVINNLYITRSGYEALHLRKFSCYNTVSNCHFDSTGMDPTAASKGYAEGVYIGSANSNWLDFSNGKIDTSDYNVITQNTFGDLILSENIDIKEGTKGGAISKNTFNGLGCNGKNSADSYIDVKGDNYKIECNTGSKNSPFILEGIQLHINKITTVNGITYNKNFGDYNTFTNNTIDLTGTSFTTGYAINVPAYAGIIHNTVCSNNIAINAPQGLTNQTTVTCANQNCNLITSSKNNITSNEEFSFYPNPASQDITIDINPKGFDVSILLRNNVGQEIFRDVIKESKYTLPVSSYKAGVYFLQIGTDIRKVLIQD